MPIEVSSTIPKKSPFKRLFWEITYALELVTAIKKINPAKVIHSNTPPLVLLICQLQINTPWIWWMQDSFSEAAKNLKILPKALRFTAWKIFKIIENYLAKKASAIVLISQDFYQLLPKNLRHKAFVIENWAPKCRPEEESDIDQTKKQKKIVYAGTVGFKHNPEKLKEIIDQTLKSGMSFQLISEGLFAEEIKKHFEGMPGFIACKFLPQKELIENLRSSMGAVFLLESDASNVAVPSKIYTYFQEFLPVFGVCNEKNLAARLIKDHGLGLLSSYDMFLELIQDKTWYELFLLNCNQYNLKYQNIQVKTELFKKILSEINDLNDY